MVSKHVEPGSHANDRIHHPIDVDTDRCSICGGEEIWNEALGDFWRRNRYECDFCGVPTRLESTECINCGSRLHEGDEICEVVRTYDDERGIAHYECFRDNPNLTLA